MRSFAPFALALLVGCATVEAPDSPQGRLLGLEADFNAAYELARQYEDLPRCGGAVVVCSEQEVVDRLRAGVVAFDGASRAAWAVLRSSGEDSTAAVLKVSTVLAEFVATVTDLQARGLIGRK